MKLIVLAALLLLVGGIIQADELPVMPAAKSEVVMPKPAAEKHNTLGRLLTLGDATFALWDVRQTQVHQASPGFYEQNPIARPLVHHPVANYALAGVEVVVLKKVGDNWRGKSDWRHKIWWLPQTVGIAGHVIGIATSTGWGNQTTTKNVLRNEAHKH
jgi:hypothetical protein